MKWVLFAKLPINQHWANQNFHNYLFPTRKAGSLTISERKSESCSIQMLASYSIIAFSLQPKPSKSSAYTL